MIKKLVIAAAGTTLLGAMLFGRDVTSYFRTSVSCVKDSVESSVPVEFQIQRARDMIKDLGPEVRKNMHVIAKEEVEVQRLDEQIGGAEARLAKEKEQILRLKSDLAGKKPLQYGSRAYTADEVKIDLANRFDRFKTGQATLTSLHGIRAARQKSLEAARQKLEGMLAAKRQLQVDVENLEARSQVVAAAQTTSNYQFDESQLGRAKELITSLKTRMEVAEKLVNAETQFQGEIPVDKSPPQNIIEQVGDYFDGKPTEAIAKNK